MSNNVVMLNENGLVSKIGSFELKTVTTLDLLEILGNYTGFTFARKFVERPCFWFSCPLVLGNVVNDLVNSTMSRTRSFRTTRVSIGTVNDAKFLLYEKDSKRELYVSNSDTRNYLLSLQDLNISSIPS